MVESWVETCKSRVDLPIPGSPPIRTRLPGTTPPPRTRLNSSMLVLVLATWMEVTSLSFMGRVFSPVRLTRSFLTSAASISSTKEDQAPQLGQRPRYLGEWYSQFWQTKVVFFLAMMVLLIIPLQIVHSNQWLLEQQIAASACRGRQ